MSKALATMMMSVPQGSIESYVSAIHSVPVLSPEQERELAVRYKDEGDLTHSVFVMLEGLPLALDKILIQILARGGELADALIPGLKPLKGTNVFLLRLPTPADFYRQFKAYIRTRQAAAISS